MSEEVILQFMAQDDISPVIQSLQSNVITSMEGIQSAISNMGQGFDNASLSVNNIGKAESVVIGSTKDATNVINDNTQANKSNTSSTRENASATRESGNATRQTTGAVNESRSALDAHTDIANLSAGSLMYLSGQMSTLGTKAEESTENLNDMLIQMDQVATMAGTTDGEMRGLITNISNETFSNEEATMYTKNLVQMGVATENLGEAATNIDRINDAFGMGAQTTNSLVTELSVLGVDMNNVSDSFNALAYANSNTKGGMENFYAFLRKYDAELNTLGYDTDQAAIIISAATQKYGGGRAALTGLSTALKEAGNDTRALEQALDLKSGALDHASQETSSYEGQLMQLANEEMEHKTILDRMGAWVDDLKVKYAGLFTAVGSGIGVFGKIGSLALYGNAIKEMGLAFSSWSKATPVINNTINRLKMFRSLSKIQKATPNAIVNPKAMTPVNVQKGKFGGLGGLGKGSSTVAKESTQVVKNAGTVGALAPEATSASAGVTATGGAMASLSGAFTTMIVPLLAIAAVIAVMIPIIAGLVAEALLFLKGIQVLIKSLNFEGIDLTKSIESIKQIGSALWEIGRAMGAMVVASLMTTFADVTTFLLQLTNPIGRAGQTLVGVANELRAFNSVHIDKSVPTKIKSITDAMKLISEAMGSLVDIVFQRAWGNLLTLGGRLGNIRDAIREAREDISHAGREIAQIKSIPNLDGEAVGKLKKVTDGIKSIGDAFDGLRKIRDGYNWDNFMGGIFKGANIQTALDSVKEDIAEASSALKNFNGVDSIPDGVGNNLKKVADALKSVGDSISTLRKLRDDYNWDDGIGSLFADSDITAQFENVKKDLVTVSNSLKSLGGEKGELGDIGKDVPNKIKKVTDAVDEVLKAVESMEKFKGKGEGEKGDDFSGVVTTIDNAKTSLITVSKSLQSLGGTGEGQEGLKAIGDDVKGKINSVSKTLNTLSKVTGNLTGFPVVSGDEIPNRVQKAVTVVQNSARHLNGMKGTQNVDASVGKVISTTGRYGGRLRKSIEQLRDFPVVSGDEIPGRVQKGVTVIQNTARHLNGIKGTKPVPASVGKVISSAGKYGGRLKSATNKLKGFPVVSGDAIPSRVQKAVTAVKNTIKHLNNLKGSSVKGGVGGILSSVSKAVSQLRKTLREIAPGFSNEGKDIGSNLKTGINTGLNGLNNVIGTQVTNGVSGASGAATTAGSTLANTVMSGFKTTFVLSSVIQGEMSAGLTAITTATPDLTNAMGVLADQMVQEFKSHAQIASPGAIARSIRDEMGYTKGFVETRGKSVITSVGNLATSMVRNFSPNLQSSLENVTGKVKGGLNRSRVEALNTIRGESNVNRQDNSSNRPVSFVFNEGAIKLDVRNMTDTEARQIMITAIESLDVVQGVNIKGA